METGKYFEKSFVNDSSLSKSIYPCGYFIIIVGGNVNNCKKRLEHKLLPLPHSSRSPIIKIVNFCRCLSSTDSALSQCFASGRACLQNFCPDGVAQPSTPRSTSCPFSASFTLSAEDSSTQPTPTSSWFCRWYRLRPTSPTSWISRRRVWSSAASRKPG